MSRMNPKEKRRGGQRDDSEHSDSRLFEIEDAACCELLERNPPSSARSHERQTAGSQ